MLESVASGLSSAQIAEESFLKDCSRLNVNSSRKLSRSATELRDNINNENSSSIGPSPEHRLVCTATSEIVQQQHRHISVAQRTHTFFTTLKSRWHGNRSKDRKKTKDADILLDLQGNCSINQESDYTADYSSEQSRSSSTTHSPARHYFSHFGSSLIRSKIDDTSVNSHDVSSGRCSDNTSKYQKLCASSDSAAISTNDFVEPIQQINDKLFNVSNSISQDESVRYRELALRQHAFFQLRLHLRRGANLIAMDRCGASDPYVKIKSCGRLLHKSRIVHRELNPVWDESVTLPIEDPLQPINFKVFDFDWGFQDDFMGAALLDLRQLNIGQCQDITLELKNLARPRQYLGEIYISATLWPRNQHEKEQYFQRSSRLAEVNRKLKSQIWSSVVTIVLVEAKNLLPMHIDGLSDPYVKFRLGSEKYKSKVANKTLNPIWLEQFDLHLYEDPYVGQELEVTLWDRDRSHQDDLMGRVVIDLTTLGRETTHRLWRSLEDGAGNIFLLLTISGTTASETISDLSVHEESHQEKVQIIQKYSLSNTLQRIKDVGHLTVKVYRAQGLAAADLGGKSDPFCVLELVNSRLQTQTEYKTLAPIWQKIFTFNVKDINSVLEVTVYDEDRDHKVEFLGKVVIPLLKIQNGEKRWYALKDKKLRCRAKGNGPQILIELTIIWNVLRACIRTLNPKEKKYMEPEIKFKRQVFLRNVLRLKSIIVTFIDLGKYIQSCWEWESKMRSIIALIFFMIVVYYFEPYMIPTAAFFVLFKYYVVSILTGASLPHQITVQIQDSLDLNADDGPLTLGDDDDDDDDKDKEEKKSLKERLQAIQEVTQTVQNSIGYIASLCERVKNLFNFTVPYLSYLAMLLAILGFMVLYFIPIRYLILVWGVNKFARKIIRPHTIPNNEILDLISRVPDDEELLNYRELKSVPTSDCEGRSLGNSMGLTASLAGGAGTMTRRELRKRHKATTTTA
ncbi:PREDICTED: multiple C2 and transmembrane domain-containing protein 1 [Ceratosolen solmsi marchali]|uniref:Multiple C2 and transmembrane domain-containing protein 1 n=1 Tax=Ceratosolen solmsi marchali TaxID=326594 RepID=A0AAJ6YSM9_9HYME|nr:PREDICTED: multiple C2 and transmembrane domain-containing protein 1 [Ceratosolen solmsi marchali]